MAHNNLETNGDMRNQGGGRIGLLRRMPPEVPIFLFYLAVTLFLTWPLIMRFATSIYGVPADNLGAIWTDWWCREAGSFGATASFCPLVGFPFGAKLGTIPMEPLSYVIKRFLLVFTNEIVAYNIETLTNFLLSGVTMYYLVRYLTDDKRAAFFGGFAYLVLPYHAYLSMFMGGGITAVQWMPLYILLLLKFMREPNGKNTALLALGAVLLAGTSLHYGLFMAIFTAAFFAGRFIARRVFIHRRAKRQGSEEKVPWEINRRTTAYSLLVLLIVVVVVSPFFYGAVLSSAQPGEWSTNPTPTHLRITKYTVWSSASPADYVYTNRADHIFSRITGRDPWASGMNPHGSLYIGWIIIALAVVGVLFAAGGGKGARLRRWKQQKEGGQPLEPPCPEKGASVTGRYNIWGFTAAALVCFMMSLPPYLTIGSVEIPLPSTLFRLVTPWFRWYLRLGVVVNLCFIALACFGLAWVLCRLRRSWLRGTVLAVLTVVLALELLIVPPFENYRCDKVPKAFEQVAELPEGTAIAFYPMVENGAFYTSTIMFYQRYFVQPMLNGAPDNSDGEALRRTVYNPYSEATPGILSRFDIGYMVFFKKWYTEDRMERPTLRLPPGLEVVDSFTGDDEFGDGYLLEVTAPPAEIVPLYLGDMTIPVLDAGAETARLMVREGSIRLLNYSGGDMRVTLSLPVKNPFSPRRVTIKKGEDVLWQSELDAGEERVARMENVTIPADGMELSVIVEGDIHLLNEDEIAIFGTESASLRIGELEITLPNEDSP